MNLQTYHSIKQTIRCCNISKVEPEHEHGLVTLEGLFFRLMCRGGARSTQHNWTWAQQDHESERDDALVPAAKRFRESKSGGAGQAQDKSECSLPWPASGWQVPNVSGEGEGNQASAEMAWYTVGASTSGHRHRAHAQTEQLAEEVSSWWPGTAAWQPGGRAAIAAVLGTLFVGDGIHCTAVHTD
jgi:hypothetical protein